MPTLDFPVTWCAYSAMTRALFLANGLPLRAITVPQFCAMYSLSRQSTYNLINAGELKSVLRGGRRLILVDSAERLLAAPRADVELIAYTCLKLSYWSISD
jgi:hypothetical protein